MSDEQLIMSTLHWNPSTLAQLKVWQSNSLSSVTGSGALQQLEIRTQGIRIKGREMALVWHEKASHIALQTGSLLHMHTLL